VGGRVEESVEVVAYDPSWPERFERERRMVVDALGRAAVAVEHIGSTAVPGLDAKPIVDILVGVMGPPAADAVEPGLQALGYESLGEAGVSGRLTFRRRRPGDAFNVHVVEYGRDLWADNVLLRDFLRTHPEEASEYAQVKRRAAAAAPDSLLRYSDLKAGAIAALLEGARAET
jgi:GrpB-like predicted nucleotidyltransferase (UPF0157 family)